VGSLVAVGVDLAFCLTRLSRHYGVHTSLVLDENDGPVVACVGEVCTSGSGDVGKPTFVRWNRSDAPWLVDEHLTALGPVFPTD